MAFQSQAAQARQRQIGGVERTTFDFRQPGFDAAAQQFHLQIGPQVQRLRLAPEAGSADRGARWQVHQAFRLEGDEAIARVFALRHAGQHDAGRHAGGQIFHRMDRGINASVQQRLIQLLGEQALAALVLQTALNLVAAGHEALDRKLVDGCAMRSGQQARDMAALRQRQWRAARSQFQHHVHSAIGGMDDRMLSTLPPVFSPKVVPRSYRRLNST